MILFDTSVVIDARDQDSPWHEWAKTQIVTAVTGAGAAVNTIVLSEACVKAKDGAAVPALLESFGINLIPLPVSAAVPAAAAFAIYRERLKKDGKKADQTKPLPDFLIGAHALAEGLALVTRDPDRVKSYFPGVNLITP